MMRLRLRPSALVARAFSVRVSGAARSGDGTPLSPFAHTVSVGEDGRGAKHRLISDEPSALGGSDAGPTPYDLLLASLGACTGMTLRMYAQRKKLSLVDVDIVLTHSKVYADDVAGCVSEAGGDCGSKKEKASASPRKVDKIERIIALMGELSEAERARLLEVANMCPVHRTLEASCCIETKLADGEATAEGSVAMGATEPGSAKKPNSKGGARSGADPEDRKEPASAHDGGSIAATGARAATATGTDGTTASGSGGATAAPSQLASLMLATEGVHAEGGHQACMPDARKLLPWAGQRSVGPFLFCLHFGPTLLGAPTSSPHEGSGAIGKFDIPPHPHIGAAILTYLFTGALEHRDSTGAQRIILPKEMSMLIAGRGVVHSERCTSAALSRIESPRVLSGLQLWLALPPEIEQAPAHLRPLEPPATLPAGEGVSALLAFGQLNGVRAALSWSSPAFFADIQLDSNAEFTAVLDAGHESACYCENGTAVQIRHTGGEQHVHKGELALLTVPDGASAASIVVRNAGEEAARVVLFGGEVLSQQHEVWWNFVATDKATISEAAAKWAAKDTDMFPPVVGEDNHDAVWPPPKQAHEKH